MRKKICMIVVCSFLSMGYAIAQLEISPFLDSIFYDTHSNPTIKGKNFMQMTFAHAIVSCRNLVHNSDSNWYLPTLEDFLLFVKPVVANDSFLVACVPIKAQPLGCNISPGGTNPRMHLRFYNGIVIKQGANTTATPTTMGLRPTLSANVTNQTFSSADVPMYDYDLMLNLQNLVLFAQGQNLSTSFFTYNKKPTQTLANTDAASLMGYVRCVRYAK